MAEPWHLRSLLTGSAWPAWRLFRQAAQALPVSYHSHAADTALSSMMIAKKVHRNCKVLSHTLTDQDITKTVTEILSQARRHHTMMEMTHKMPEKYYLKHTDMAILSRHRNKMPKKCTVSECPFPVWQYGHETQRLGHCEWKEKLVCSRDDTTPSIWTRPIAAAWCRWVSDNDVNNVLTIESTTVLTWSWQNSAAEQKTLCMYVSNVLPSKSTTTGQEQWHFADGLQTL